MSLAVDIFPRPPKPTASAPVIDVCVKPTTRILACPLALEALILVDRNDFFTYTTRSTLVPGAPVVLLVVVPGNRLDSSRMQNEREEEGRTVDTAWWTSCTSHLHRAEHRRRRCSTTPGEDAREPGLSLTIQAAPSQTRRRSDVLQHRGSNQRLGTERTSAACRCRASEEDLVRTRGLCCAADLGQPQVNTLSSHPDPGQPVSR